MHGDCPGGGWAVLELTGTLNDRDRLTKWGYQLVEQAINTSSGNGGDVITLIIHIAVIVEHQ